MSHLICTLVQWSRLLPLFPEEETETAWLVTCLSLEKFQLRRKNLIGLQGAGSFNSIKMGIYIMPADGKENIQKEIEQKIFFQLNAVFLRSHVYQELQD